MTLFDTVSDKTRKVVAIAVMAVVIAVCVATALAIGPQLWDFFSNGDAIRSWAKDQGILAPLGMAALIAVQITVAVLPGEPLELASGWIFGFWGGTGVCLLGSFLGSVAVLALVKLLGLRFVHVFFSPEKLSEIKWLKDSARFEIALFAIFLIPGAPKDILIFAAGLTNCPWWRIALITTFGRVPSIVTSTLAAAFAMEGNWVAAAVVFAVTLAIVVAGGVAYAKISRAHKLRKQKESADAAEHVVAVEKQPA